MDLKKLYSNRFDRGNDTSNGDLNSLSIKNNIWKTLCLHFFNKYIPKDAVVIDMAAGYCEFINNIEINGHGKKIAIDLNEDIKKFSATNVNTFNVDIINEFDMIDHDDFPKENSVDVIFISNFLEHLPDKKYILLLFDSCRKLLKPDGKLLILQPNIKYTGMAYYDFFDHFTPLTEKSLEEALEMSGYKINECIVRFLPYTTKSALPKKEWMIKLYLKLPFAWRFFGQQSFISASPIKA